MTTSASSTHPSASDLQLGFYEQFFFSKNLEPYPIQEQAFDEIFAGKSVLVTVPVSRAPTNEHSPLTETTWQPPPFSAGQGSGGRVDDEAKTEVRRREHRA